MVPCMIQSPKNIHDFINMFYRVKSCTIMAIWVAPADILTCMNKLTSYSVWFYTMAS